MLEQFDKDRKQQIPLPEIGSIIYVYDGDEFQGGRATVEKVVDGVSEGQTVPFVVIKEKPGARYNWHWLYAQQSELRQIYGDQLAHVDTDPSRALGTREQIESWFVEGKAREATHMIIVCDKWDYRDSPIYVMPGENARAIAAYFNNEDPRKVSGYVEGVPCGLSEEALAEFDQPNRSWHTCEVMEVYCLSGSLQEQINQPRSFNYE